MDILKAFIAGIVQGIAEFLPISSSGHLAVLHKVLNHTENSLFFDTVLHGGSLIAVLIVYYKDILKLFIDLKDKNLHMIKCLFIGTLPAVFAGLFLEDKVEALFADPKHIGFFYFFTAFVLFLGHKKTKNNEDTKNTITYKTALLIGIAQAVAIFPGVSRSGMTITCALLLLINRAQAAKFSFLLSIPVIGGAMLLQSLKVDLTQVNFTELSIGFFSSAVFGYIAIKLLLQTLKKAKFGFFAIYCLLFGILILAYL